MHSYFSLCLKWSNYSCPNDNARAVLSTFEKLPASREYVWARINTRIRVHRHQGIFKPVPTVKAMNLK